jgi:hypothetical protein
MHTSVIYSEATGGPNPIPIPTKNLPKSIPSRLLVRALQNVSSSEWSKKHNNRNGLYLNYKHIKNKHGSFQL